MDNAAKDYLTPMELRRAGMEAIFTKLGAAGLARFISQSERGLGDFTASKHELWGDATLNDITNELESMNNLEKTT